MAEINGEEKRIGVSGEQIEEVVGKMPAVEADVKENKQNISALQTASAQHTAEMNTAIQANTKAIADNATAIQANTTDIEKNKSDILKVQRRSSSFSVETSGWYRILESDSISTRRSMILRLIRGYGNNPGEILTLSINIIYWKPTAVYFDCHILDAFRHSALIRGIRMVCPEVASTAPFYIDVYYGGTSSNPLGTEIFGETTGSSAVTPVKLVNPTPINEVPEGYVVKQIDLTDGDIFDKLTDVKNDIKAASENNLYLNADGVWAGVDSTTAKHVCFPVKSGDEIIIKANTSRNTYYAALTSNTAIQGGKASFSADVNWNTRKTQNAATTSDKLIMPSDAKYLYIASKWGSDSYYPISVKINEVEKLYTIEDKISELVNRIVTLETALSQTQTE